MNKLSLNNLILTPKLNVRSHNYRMRHVTLHDTPFHRTQHDTLNKLGLFTHGTRADARRRTASGVNEPRP